MLSFKQFFLLEKYFEYSIPTSIEKRIYDFYVLNYLDFVARELPVKNFREEDVELRDSVIEAFKKCASALREEILTDVAASISSEIMGHLFTSDFFKGSFKDRAKKYLSLDEQNLINRLISSFQTKFKSNIRDEDEPSAEAMWEVASDILKSNNVPRAKYVAMCEKLFDRKMFVWKDTLFGGSAWQGICEGWLRLARSKPNSSEETIAIDHVFDLQHNTGSVFNKLQKFYDTAEFEEEWLQQVLDHKASVTDIYELLPVCSGQVKSLAIRILKERQGKTYQQMLPKINKPVSYTDKEGNKITKVNNKFHSINDKPAFESKYYKIWYKEGKKHRDGDKPADITKNQLGGGAGERIDMEWYKEGKLHREGNKPAQIVEVNGKVVEEGFYKNGSQIKKKLSWPDQSKIEYYGSSDAKQITEKQYNSL